MARWLCAMKERFLSKPAPLRGGDNYCYINGQGEEIDNLLRSKKVQFFKKPRQREEDSRELFKRTNQGTQAWVPRPSLSRCCVLSCWLWGLQSHSARLEKLLSSAW